MIATMIIAAMSRLIAISNIVHCPASHPRLQQLISSQRLDVQPCPSRAAMPAKIKQLPRFALAPHALAQLVGCAMIELKPRSRQHDAIVLACALRAQEPAGDVIADTHRVSLDWFPPSPTACGAKNDAIPRPHANVVDLRGKRLALAILEDQPFLRAIAGPAAKDAPRLARVAIVVNGNFAVLEEQIHLFGAIAAAMLTGSAAVGNAAVVFNQHGVIGLEVLRRNAFEQRPPGVGVHAVTDRAARDAAE